MPRTSGKAQGRPAEGRYRERWRWDSVTWGSHCVDCYPSNCPFRVFVRDGKVVREEQAGTFPVIEAGVPDMNPAGCQEVGPESIIRIGEPAEGGTQALICGGALVGRLGGITTDVQAEINDFSPGLYITYGKFDPAASVDDWFHSA